MSRQSPSRPVRPRDAASLILLRGSAGRREVLMGRRPDASRFMPNRWVFPGGALETPDSRARPASALDPSLTALLAVGGHARRARALAMAAVRETFEETGLVLGARGDVGEPGGETWSEMRALGLAPALGRLAYVGRAITPVPYPIRFHARFFVADASHAHGALALDSELEDLRWVPLGKAAHLDMADVQAFMLAHAEKSLAQLHDAPGPKPLFTQRAGERYIRYERASEDG
ncbi:MAG: NUDIX hydrolase [Gammaproteobacteria bacterium]|nr:NUDIX hydrolase [Gammaproteobacteria bacterium]